MRSALVPALVRHTLVFAGIFLLLCLGARSVGVTWDEAIYFEFSDIIRHWARSGFPLSAAALHDAWAYNAVTNPHPPFMKILSAFFAAAFPGAGFPLSYRLGHVFFASAGLTLIHALLSGRFGGYRSLAGVLFILFQPRLFAEFFLGNTDGPVAIAWIVLALLAWRIQEDSGSKNKRWWLLFWAVHGVATSTKLTGFLAALPVAAYYLAKRNKRALLLCLASFPLALVALAFFSPEYWHAPLSGIWSYLTYIFRRGHVMDVSTFFLWSRYGEHPPPLYFPVMTALTAPPLTLLGALLFPLAWREPGRKSLALALLPGLLAWLVLGMLPITPKHDGTREFAALFPFLGLAAWLGFMSLAAELALRHAAFRRRSAALLLLPAPLLAGAAAVAQSNPFELSYYNSLIGGLRGADQAGLELTYYLEALNGPTLRWMNENLPEGASVSLLPAWYLLLQTYQRKGLLRPDLRIVLNSPNGQRVDLEQAQFVVLERRRSLLDDDAFFSGKEVWRVEHEGVPLLRIVRLGGRP
jgi:4-amino-4-deoxy-L-arabinose transferase-like glycosyltransferase